MKARPSKPDDQENVEKAYKLIIELIELNPQIEMALWESAISGALVNGFKGADFSCKEFCERMDMIKDYYIAWWDED